MVASHSHLFKLSSPKHKHKLAFVYLNPYDYSITAWMPISRGIFESRGGIPLYQRSLPWWWTPGSEQAWRENGHVIHAAFWGLLISRRGHKSYIIITYMYICIASRLHTYIIIYIYTYTYILCMCLSESRVRQNLMLSIGGLFIFVFFSAAVFVCFLGSYFYAFLFL